MRIVLGGARSLRAVALAVGVMLAGLCLAQEPTAASFIRPMPDKQCDEFNRSWVVANQHTYLSIKVRVRWTAVGARAMQEDIVLSPGQSRAIGCAAELEILSAEIMEF